jgi:hypothetical protein
MARLILPYRYVEDLEGARRRWAPGWWSVNPAASVQRLKGPRQSDRCRSGSALSCYCSGRASIPPGDLSRAKCRRA